MLKKIFKTKILIDLVNFSKLDGLFKLGVEYELFAIDNSKRMVNHEDISGFFKRLESNSLFKAIYEKSSKNNSILALGSCGNNFCFNSEPGCQLEISLNPFSEISEIENNFLKCAKLIKKEMPYYNILAYGINPICDLHQIPFLEKIRYKIMWEYMFKNNIFGHMMMKSTCTMQFNIDYSSEKDAYRKFLASVLIQPILISLFANSRYKNRENTGFVSYRSYIWQGMSNLMKSNYTNGFYSRAGIPSFIFLCNESNFFSEYINYCMNVPICFCCREDKHIVFGDSYNFSDFIDGRIQKDIISGKFSPEIFSNGENIELDLSNKDLRKEIASLILPNENDWYNHVNTIFFETRIQKGYIEMRSLDSCPKDYLLGASDFWLQFSLNNDLLDFILNNFSFSGSVEEQTLKCENLYYRAAKFGLDDPEILKLAEKLVSALNQNSLAKEVLSELLLRDPKKDLLDVSFLFD